MGALLLITIKDLRLRARDRSFYIVGIAAPLGLALIFHLTIGDALSGDIGVELAVVDQDGGEVSSRFVDALDDVEDLDIRVVDDLGEEQARAAVDRETLDAALVIPPRFTQGVMTAPGTGADLPRITVVGNVNSSLGTQIATALAEGFATRVNAGRLAVATALAAPEAPAAGADRAAGLVAEAMAQEPPVGLVDLPAGDRQLDGATYLVAGMSILFLFFTVQLGVTGLLEERDLGTLTRLRAAPIRPLTVPAAKALASAVLGAVSLAVIVVTSSVTMGADWGHPLVVAAVGAAALLAAISIMGIVAGLARTPEQAGGYQAIIAIALAALGGSFFPITRAEGLLTFLATFTPHRWYLRGLGEGQEGLVAALPSVAMLLVFALVAGGLGVLVLSRRPAG